MVGERSSPDRRISSRLLGATSSPSRVRCGTAWRCARASARPDANEVAEEPVFLAPSSGCRADPPSLPRLIGPPRTGSRGYPPTPPPDPRRSSEG
eukprot:4435605-Pyramimonas_sp.AAC.1